MRKLSLALLMLWMATYVLAQNTPPQVIIQQVAVDEALKNIIITYDLLDAEYDTCEVWVKVSSLWNEYFELIDPMELTGDLGPGVSPGTGHTILWHYDSLPVSVFMTKVGVYASDGHEIQIQTMVDQVDSVKLLENLMWIEGVRHYQAAPLHLDAVRDSLESLFNYYGIHTERQAFPYGNTQGFNIVGRKAGLKDESVSFIVCGHYDGVPGSPAADDNGSAVTGVLEILRILSEYQFENTLLFVGFDLEEHGLIGSKYFVQHEIKPYEDIQGALNFEMIAYYDETPYSQSLPPGFDMLFPQQVQTIQADSSRGNFLIVVGNTTSNSLITTFVNAATQYVPDLITISLEVPGNGQIAPDLRRSDHAPFWDTGRKALMISDGADTRNPYYHTPGDSIGTLNFTFLEKNVKATLAALATLAGPVSAGYDTFDLSVLSVSDNDPSTREDFLIYPNPGREQITIRFICQGELPNFIEISDRQGRVIKSYPISCTGHEVEYTADLSGLTTGVYLVAIRSGERVMTRRMLRI